MQISLWIQNTHDRRQQVMCSVAADDASMLCTLPLACLEGHWVSFAPPVPNTWLLSLAADLAAWEVDTAATMAFSLQSMESPGLGSRLVPASRSRFPRWVLAWQASVCDLCRSTSSESTSVRAHPCWERSAKWQIEHVRKMHGKFER